MSDLLTVEQRNTRRLAKIHKLKRENRVLASRRNRLMNKKIAQMHGFGQMSDIGLYRYSIKLNRISEQIGKNSDKILRLRTLINQDKAWESRPRLLDPRKIVYVE